MEGKNNHKFIIVMSILSFILIIIGGSFAYFTAKARSDERSLDMASHFVQVGYNDGTNLQADDLIPTSDNVAMRSYNGESVNGQCKDDNNRTVCSIYSFDVTNLGSIEQHLGARINIEKNGIIALKYALFNVTGNSDIHDSSSKIKVSEGFIPNTINNPDYLSTGVIEPYYVIGGPDQLEQIVYPNITEKYELVLWLYDNNDAQNYEQGKQLVASMTVSLTDQEHVYGYIEEINGG